MQDGAVQKLKKQPVVETYGVEADQHWTEIMELAEKYGFVLQAYAGTATLATHKVQLEELGEPEYLRIQQMNGHCAKDFGYSGCLTREGEHKECGSCWVTQTGPKWVRFKKNERYQRKE